MHVKANHTYILFLICLLVFIAPLQAHGQEKEPAAEEQEQVMITLNDVPIDFEDSVLLENKRVFVPIRLFVDRFGGTIEWEEQSREVTIMTALGDRLVFGIDNPVMTFNEHEYRMDVSPFLRNGHTYLPIRHAAEFVHMDVSWDPEARIASLVSIPLHMVAEGDTLKDLAEKYETTEKLLLERNELETLAVAGAAIKVVIPEIMADIIVAKPEKKPMPKPEPKPKPEPVKEDPIDKEELGLLSRIVQVEAGYESYQAQLAIANVILNRVKDGSFPNSVREVIYAPGQFPPAHNGLLDQTVAGANALKAAKAALSGVNNVKGALYFYNPSVTSGEFWDSLTLIAKIGSHRFMGR